MHALFIMLTFVSHNCAGHIATKIYIKKQYMNRKKKKKKETNITKTSTSTFIQTQSLSALLCNLNNLVLSSAEYPYMVTEGAREYEHCKIIMTISKPKVKVM